MIMIPAHLLTFFLILTIPGYDVSGESGRRRTRPAKPMQNPHLFEGDMILSPVASAALSSGISLYAATSDTSLLWPDGRIYYQFGIKDEGLRNLVRRAMDHIEKRTCIRFIERGVVHRFLGVNDYVTIIRGKGCYSLVGRGRGSQLLSLGPGCENESIIIHELMHAIGFFHKHSRSDRDQFLHIHWDNIDKKMWPQFEKLNPEENQVLTPFDYMSIMLYGDRTFSYDDFSITMTRKDGGRLIDVPFKNGLSKHDVYNVNHLYDCPDMEDIDNEEPVTGTPDANTVSDSDKKVADSVIVSKFTEQKSRR